MTDEENQISGPSGAGTRNTSNQKSSLIKEKDFVGSEGILSNPDAGCGFTRLCGSTTNMDKDKEEEEQLVKDHITDTDVATNSDTNTDNHVTSEEFGQLEHVQYVNHSSSFHPKQYFIGKVLHREPHHRKVTWDELFLDLIYVAVINRTGYLLKVKPLQAYNVNQFMLVFIVVWMLSTKLFSFSEIEIPIRCSWKHTHVHSNRIGADHLIHRLFFWLQMILVAAMGINALNAFEPDPVKNTANLFIGTYLLSRAISISYNILVCFKHPKFAPSLIPTIIGYTLANIPWFISIFVSQQYQVMLWWLSFALDFVFFHGAIFIIRRMTLNSNIRIAINIEHHAERLGLLTIIVLGELVIALLFDSENPNLSYAYLGVVLGMILALCFQMIYFRHDGGKQFVHALRRNAYTGLSWQATHLPLHASITAAGAVLAKLILQMADPTTLYKKIDPGQLWVFAGCSALVLILNAFLAALHKTHIHNVFISKNVRLVNRVVVGGLMLLVGGLGTNLNPLEVVSIISCMGIYAMIIEELSFYFYIFLFIDVQVYCLGTSSQ